MNYATPLRSGEGDANIRRKFEAGRPDVRKRFRETPTRFRHHFDQGSAVEVSEKERLANYEEFWKQPGFTEWMRNFRPIMTSREAYENFAEFVRNKFRERVTGSEVAELLGPQPAVRFQEFPVGKRLFGSLQSSGSPTRAGS